MVLALVYKKKYTIKKENYDVCVCVLCCFFCFLF